MVVACAPDLSIAKDQPLRNHATWSLNTQSTSTGDRVCDRYLDFADWACRSVRHCTGEQTFGSERRSGSSVDRTMRKAAWDGTTRPLVVTNVRHSQKRVLQAARSACKLPTWLRNPLPESYRYRRLCIGRVDGKNLGLSFFSPPSIGDSISSQTYLVTPFVSDISFSLGHVFTYRSLGSAVASIALSDFSNRLHWCQWHQPKM